MRGEFKIHHNKWPYYCCQERSSQKNSNHTTYVQILKGFGSYHRLVCMDLSTTF